MSKIGRRFNMKTIKRQRGLFFGNPATPPSVRDEKVVSGRKCNEILIFIDW